MSAEVKAADDKSGRVMFQQLESIRDVMMDSLMKNYVPFPIDRSICSAWTDTLRKGGDTIIYTSFMYQLSSLFRAYEKHLSTFARMGGSARLASLGKFFIKPDKDDLRRGYRILSNISALLLKNGIDHGYLYDDEPYSGGLLLELGMLDQFWEYGARVLKLMKDHGVRRVITVDPHTTNAMNRLKEHFEADIEVHNYLTLIQKYSGKGKFVFHDPCLYSRYDTIGNRIREIASTAGVQFIEDRMVTNRDLGTCCGGPLGPVNMDLSDSIAKYRAGKLLSVSQNVMVACPLCYQNLKPYVSNMKDVAEVIE